MSSEKARPDQQDPVLMVINNLLEFMQGMTVNPDTEYRDMGNLITLSCPVAHPMMNAVVQTNFDPETVDTDIQQVIAYFKDRSLPFSWFVWPNSGPENLGKRLLENGLTYGYAAPDMIADLSQLPDKVPQAEGLEIERVRNEEMMADWMIPIEQAFQLPDEVNDFFFNVFISLGLEEDKRTRHFIAYLNGAPAACSTVLLDSYGVAGIWNVATIPDARGKGIGTAVTWQACEVAKQLGYETGILQSSEMGYNIYKRLGFEEAFKNDVYIWQPPEELT